MMGSRRRQLQLEDGRYLDIEESGPAGAQVLLFHHGTPGSCVQFRALAGAAHELGLRFVTTSRPGYGDSTRQGGRSVVDVVADTQALLDAIGADRCFVAGWSGGGPHALACGARLTHRVAAVLVIAGVAPYDADGLSFLEGMGEENLVEFGKALNGEQALRQYLEEVRPHLLDVTGEQIVGSLGGLLPPIDRAALTGEFGDDMATNFREALRRGVDGWLDDDLAFVQPWGFDLAEITVPTFVWQGSEDLMVPFSHGSWLVERIPDVRAHLMGGEGHLSIALGATEAMLRELIGAA